MRLSKSISDRMREILVQDKINVKEGFYTALKRDVEKLLLDYFDFDKLTLEIGESLSGDYDVKISLVANNIKKFDTTFDVKRY